MVTYYKTFLILDLFKSFLKYKRVTDIIEEATFIDSQGKMNFLEIESKDQEKHLLSKVKAVYPNGEFQIDLSKVKNISTARFDFITFY